MRDIDTALLRSFIHVAETGNFTKAADRVHRSQSAVSIQIKNLEAVVGRQLFDRKKRNVRLTPHGEILLDYARQILRMNDEAYHKISSGGERRLLRLGIVEYLAPHRLPAILTHLRNAFPQYDIRVTVDLSSRLREHIRNETLDIAICASEIRDAKGDPLFLEQLVWVAAKGQSRIDDTIPLALLPAPCLYRSAATEALDRVERPWYCAITTMNVSGVQSAVSAGLATSVIGTTSIDKNMIVLDEQHGFPSLGALQVSLERGRGAEDIDIREFVEFLADCIQNNI